MGENNRQEDTKEYYSAKSGEPSQAAAVQSGREEGEVSVCVCLQIFILLTHVQMNHTQLHKFNIVRLVMSHTFLLLD